MIRCVIFDLGGTLIDKYSMSPLVNLRKAFSFRNINLCNSLVSKDMGMKKLDHIYALSKEDEFKNQFKQVYKRHYDVTDLYDIYNIFCSLQRETLKNNMELIPETKNVIDYLKERDIKIGITTGFNKDQMNIALELLKKHDIVPDVAVSSTCMYNTNREMIGRPCPYMIYNIMDELNISDPKKILKVDDTCVGIKEGKNAGCLTVGVARWSINMGITKEEDLHNLSDKTIKEKLKKSRNILLKEDPTYLINTLDELQYCLDPLYLNLKKDIL